MIRNINLRINGKIITTTDNGEINIEEGNLLFTLDDKNCTVTIANKNIGLTANFMYVYNLIRDEIIKELEAKKQGKNSEKYS